MKIERKNNDEFQGLWQQQQQQLEAPWHLAPHHTGTHGTRMQTCKSVSTHFSDPSWRDGLHYISLVGWDILSEQLS